MNCPFCSEEIKDDAQVCKHCGRDFLLVRALLDQFKGHAKRLDNHDTDLAHLGQFLRRRPDHHGVKPDGVIPALSPLNAIVLCVAALFVTSFFLDLVAFARAYQAPKHLGPLPAGIPAVAFFFETFAFGLMCQPAKTRPLVADLTAGFAITILSIAARYCARLAVLGVVLDWDEAVPLIWLAVGTFLSFSAGGFCRYLIQSQTKSAPPITYATDLSRYLVGRQSIDPTQIQERTKAFEAILHSLLAVVTTVGAILGTWTAIDKSRAAAAHQPSATPPAVVGKPSSPSQSP